MPMMMDESLDDLFGDEPLPELPTLPNLRPVPRVLVQSTDNALVSGCSQKLAWSNQGCIANIANDGQSVTLRNLYCSPETGLWELSEGDEAKIIAVAHNGNPLKHLSWSHSGTELAVADILGNISVFTLAIAINHCTVSRRCALGTEDNLSAIVGLSWLNQDRSLPLHRPAVKTPNGQWAFMGSRFKQSGPHNPHLVGEQAGKNKAALVTITRTGVIRMIYQGPDGARWLDFRGELQNISTAADLCTHATMCADKDSSMLVATYSVSKHIRVYKVEVDWPGRSFIIEHVKIIADCSSHSQEAGEGGLAAGLPYPEAQLYHLEIVSPAPAIRSKEDFSPLLLGFVCNSSPRDNHPLMGHSPLTSIVRWEMTSIKPTLHPGFSQLASKRSNASKPSELQSELIFRRLPEIDVNSIIVSVQQLNLGTTLAFCLSDGTVEFRNRPGLDLLPPDNSPDRASSLVQVGLEFPSGNPCLYAALSPNACAVITVDDGDVANLRLMQVPQAYADNPPDSGIVEALAEAFVMQFQISCSGYANYHDDLSATMQMFQNEHLREDNFAKASTFLNPFLSDIHRVISVNVDFSGDTKTELYLRNGLHPRMLSMQLSLGYRGEQQHRSLSSKVAFAILQLRWATLTFAMGLKPNPPGMTLPADAELKRTETVRSFFGVISWTLSLMNYVVDEIFTLAAAIEDNSASEDGTANYDAVTDKICEFNTPALALLFVSQSRLLFKYNFRFFRNLGVEITQQRPHHPTWRELGSIFSKSPVPLQQFERVLAEVDASVRSVYESEQIPEAERKDIEKCMLITGSVSPRLWPAVEALLTKTLKSLREEVDVAELYFHDVSWLGLSDDKASDRWRKEHRLDVNRKVELSKRARLRQCTRCCSVMEDTPPPNWTAGWLVNMWRTCVCGNWWMSMKDEGPNTNENGNRRR